MLRIKPVQTISRSFSSTARRHIATTIDNGAKGQKPWPSTKHIFTNYSKGIASFATWTVAFYAVMFWPVAPRVLSDYINDVPSNLTGLNIPAKE
ncbi:hypothetical protein JA1_000836 [Spathaspora sp. JA1]|nr:hypothetical protein JA1_000836 [Spathaspora sp. JA1]